MQETYEKLIAHLRPAALLGSIEAILSWDQETGMPSRATTRRAEQIAAISEIQHERRTDPKIGELLETLEGSDGLDDAQRADVREARRTYDRQVKLPTDLVTEIARNGSLAAEAWKKARAADDFASFAPWLEKNFELARRKADLLGHNGSPYDALLEEFEPGMTSARLTELFTELRHGLVPLVEAIAEAPRQPDLSLLSGTFPAEVQEALCREVSADLGFDFEAGRLDRSAHPFCSGTSPEDVRLTTRYDETNFRPAFFGVMHETGHGLYEQGLDPERTWTPTGTARSLGIHESQSRLWENQVGRSLSFWRRYLPRLQERFRSLADVPLEAFHHAVNAVRPSLIRVEADEATYNLHILLRFDLERDLLEKRIEVRDLPEVWRDRMASDLGVRPETDADGVLQDIHWSWSLVGYFPTYTLGNLLSAQLYAAAQAEIPGLEEGFARGEFAPLLTWLRQRIHRQGSLLPTPELIEQAVGEPLGASAFLSYLRERVGRLYGLS